MDYAAAKAGVIGLTRYLASERAPYGILINAAAPGPTATELLQRHWAARPAETNQKVFAQVPLGRLATPAEVAGAICFPCSDAASQITGAVIDVNGGLFGD